VMRERAATPAPATVAGAPVEVVLTVVVPVYNQEASIVANVATIRRSIASGLDAEFELIVVSDGSIDRTAERVLEAADENVRLIHYDRNLGKGYAIKTGALEARGRYVAYIDADLDLDPAWLPRFVNRLEEGRLDFAIGSKRHADSKVDYPRSRRVYSWLYQQLVRVLFRLDVRDTQVGLKVFRREVAEQVLPLLLVKRYAFDLEMLAVARALGFRRIEELPIRLDYRFSGSGVNFLAVARALVDTGAIFYRLRILRYYQRKRMLGGAFGWTRPRGFEPLVSVITRDPAALTGLDYPNLEVVALADSSPQAVHRAAREAAGSVLAFLEEGGRPAGNWITATVPFLRREEVAAVVVPKVAPRDGTLGARAASAIVGSRLGGGSLYFRFTPGNLRYVRDFPAASVVVQRDRYLDLGEAVTAQEVTASLTAKGSAVLYTPETVVVGATPRLFRPHLQQTFAYGRRRGVDVRLRGVRAVRRTTLLPVVLLVFLAVGPLAVQAGVSIRTAWLALALFYAAAVAVSATIAALSFRNAAVGILAAAGLVLTHLTYAAGFLRGLARA
jgi:glycosyltransferase involved in cell wall biosynthesis